MDWWTVHSVCLALSHTCNGSRHQQTLSYVWMDRATGWRLIPLRNTQANRVQDLFRMTWNVQHNALIWTEYYTINALKRKGNSQIICKMISTSNMLSIRRVDCKSWTCTSWTCFGKHISQSRLKLWVEQQMSLALKLEYETLQEWS